MERTPALLPDGGGAIFMSSFYIATAEEYRYVVYNSIDYSATARAGDKIFVPARYSNDYQPNEPGNEDVIDAYYELTSIENFDYYSCFTSPSWSAVSIATSPRRKTLSLNSTKQH